MEIVAYTKQDYICSECGSLMQSNFLDGKRLIACLMPRCGRFQEKFIVPSTRLEPWPSEEINQVATPKPPPNRFAAFNPDEREIMRVLLQEHSNTVSQCAIALDVRVSAYLLAIEELEAEVNDA